MINRVKKNLLFNYIGQGWSAIMGFAFIPLYIKYLGVESYALVGLFAMLFACLNLLDIGMTPTLSREMARFTGGGQSCRSIKNLLRTVEILILIISFTIALCVVILSNWIATSWLKTECISPEVVEQAISIMGVVAGIRFIEGIYRSVIIGLQRQVLFNIFNCIISTLRGLGAVGILIWFSPTIQAFFIWQGIISITSLIVLSSITYFILPKGGPRARFSWNSLRSIWGFASGIFVVMLLSFILTQSDKLLLSKLLNLSEYGYYTLAATVASFLHMTFSPITQALYPRLCELHANKRYDAFNLIFHKGAQVVSILAGSTAIVLILNAESVLLLWTQDDDLTSRTAPIMKILIFGNMLNSFMSIPYQAQLAHGWTKLSLNANLIAVFFVIPAIFIITPRFGSQGTAWIYVVLNIGYLIFGTYFMHRKILKTEKMRWLCEDIIKPNSAGLIFALLLSLYLPLAQGILQQFLKLMLVLTVTIMASLLASTQIRKETFKIFNKFNKSQINHH